MSSWGREASASTRSHAASSSAATRSGMSGRPAAALSLMSLCPMLAGHGGGARAAPSDALVRDDLEGNGMGDVDRSARPDGGLLEEVGG